MRLDVDFINAMITQVGPPNHFKEGYYRFKWAQYVPAQSSFTLQAQWLALPRDPNGTRRAMYFNVVIDAESLLGAQLSPASHKQLDKVVERRDYALERLRGMIAAAHVGELLSDTTQGAAARQVRAVELSLGGSPLPIALDSMLDMDRAINDAMGW